MHRPMATPWYLYLSTTLVDDGIHVCFRHIMANLYFLILKNVPHTPFVCRHDHGLTNVWAMVNSVKCTVQSFSY